MKLNIIFCFLFLVPSIFTSGHANAPVIDKVIFYAALASDKLEEINTQLSIIRNSSIVEKDAYEGALLMKKSGLLSNAKEKLSVFKAGRAKLESSILKDANNAEYRFLRIIIQENAPKIVKYRNDLEADSQLIQANFKSLPGYLQQVIMDYSKKSKFLKPS